MPKTTTNQSRTVFTYNAITSAATAEQEQLIRTYERRNASQQLAGDINSNLFKCGRTHFAPVTMGITAGKAGKPRKASYRGLITCGSVWACPACNWRILQTRRREIKETVDIWDDKDGYFVTETLTLPHSKRTSLKRIMSLMADAVAAWNKDNSLKKVKAKMGYAGYVRIIEIPNSFAHGWHPHYVFLYFVDRELTAEELGEWKKASQKVWRASLEKVGVTRASGKAHYLGMVENPKALATYMTKYMDKAPALASSSPSNEFSPEVGTRSHWEILSSWMATHSEADKSLWREWVSDTKGRHFTSWARGFRQSLGLDESPDDSKIVEEGEEEKEEEEEHKPLLTIQSHSLATLVGIPRRQASYLHQLSTMDFYDFLMVLEADGIEYNLTEDGISLLKIDTREFSTDASKARTNARA